MAGIRPERYLGWQGCWHRPRSGAQDRLERQILLARGRRRRQRPDQGRPQFRAVTLHNPMENSVRRGPAAHNFSLSLSELSSFTEFYRVPFWRRLGRRWRRRWAGGGGGGGGWGRGGTTCRRRRRRIRFGTPTPRRRRFLLSTPRARPLPYRWLNFFFKPARHAKNPVTSGRKQPIRCRALFT